MAIDNSKNEKLTVAYSDPINKITFYCLKDPTYLPAQRFVPAMRAKRFSDLKITEESLREIIKKIKHAVNVEKDFLTAFGWWCEVELRLNMICEEDSILELVKLYYYLPDEDPEFPTAEANKKKSEIFERYPLVKGFFLRIGINMMENFGMKHDEEVLSYLQETTKVAERIKIKLEQ